MLKVLIDTNALIYSFDGKKDIYSIFDRNISEPFSLYCIDSCINELKALGRKDVVKWVYRNKIEVIKTEEGGNTDDKIVEKAAEGGFAVMTEDKKLIDKARVKNIKTVRIAGNGLIVL